MTRRPPRSTLFPYTDALPIAQHGRDHRPVSATRLAGDAAMTRLRQRGIAGVDPGDDLVAKVRVVFARAGRVDVLAATHRRPGVDRKSTRLNSSHSQISYAAFC